MAQTNTKELAEQLYQAHIQGQPVENRPSSNDKEFGLPAAYQVVHEIAALNRQNGWQTSGRKIGFTNRAVWPKLELDTIVWGYVYDKTVHYVPSNQTTFSLKNTVAPRIEPEIIFKFKTSPAIVNTSAAEVLEAVEWFALGYEIVDCPYPNWRFRPADMVAAWGFHSALLIGQTHPISDFEKVAEQLASFKLNLIKNGQTAAEGVGSNVFDSPALCLGQLIRTLHEHDGINFAPLQAGEVVTSGTVTDAQNIAPGEEWKAEVSGLDLPAFTVKFTE